MSITYNMNYIEKVLRFKAESEGCNILVGQWEYDRKLIPEALKAVVVMFPHFSLHDDTHSQTILDNICNVLGIEVINQLSCSDLWLLLEAAYCHDLGMVITAPKIDEAFKSGDFLTFYHRVLSNPHHDLFKYANLFIENNGILEFKNKDVNLSSFDAIKFLFAEYFRKQHGSNARKALVDPLGQIGVDSPRSVIPARLYDLLGDICALHTMGFADVMKLPYIENGISLDKAHPRFVACMLRIGDLLDLDNHRFNETLLRTLDEMPDNSMDHYHKHQSIKHYRVDNKYIEVTAQCKNPRVAKITRDWFSWLKEEFNNQSQRWNDIVPHEINCYLPTVNQLSVDVDGYYNVDKYNEPKFTIDVEKALELLQGKNFYKSPFDSIREILQNAVDSTLIRLFLDCEEDGEIPQSPDNTFFEKIANNYPINVTVQRNSKNEVVVVVDDRGMGLKRSHLQFLSNTGSSSRNIEKKLIIDRMPEWLRPSGIFGIGFQSIFLLTDEINIETKDYETDECYSIEMHKPNSKMNGDIYLKPLGHRKSPGLCIRFRLNEFWSKKPLAQDRFSGVDTDEVENTLNKAIKNYAVLSLIPIKLNGQYIPRKEMKYYDPETGIELSFDDLSFGPNNTGTNYYFKNAKVESNGPTIPFLHPTVNILKGQAKDLLTLDRNSFKTEKTKEIGENVVKAITSFIMTEDYDHIVTANNTVKILFYLFARQYEIDLPVSKMESTFSVTLNLGGGIVNLDQMLSYTKVSISTISDYRLKITPDATNNTCEIETNQMMYPHHAVYDEYLNLVYKLLNVKHSCCTFTNYTVSGYIRGGRYTFSDDKNEITNMTISEVNTLLHISEKRQYLVYISGYDAIRIPSTKGLDDGIFMESTPFHGIEKKIEKILSPFIKINDVVYDCRTDKLYEYVSSLNSQPIDSIRSCYDRFVADCQANGVKFEKYEME